MGKFCEQLKLNRCLFDLIQGSKLNVNILVRVIYVSRIFIFF